MNARPRWTLPAALALWLVLPALGRAAYDEPVQAVEALHAALNTADVERSSALFTDDAVVIQPRIGGMPQAYVGQEQIRWWLRNLAAQHAQWTVAQPARVVDPVTLEWIDSFSLDAYRELGLDSVEVRSDVVLAADGRITSLTTVLSPAAARSVQIAPGDSATPTEPSGPLAERT